MMLFSQMEPAIMPAATTSKARPVEERLAKLKGALHVTITPQLAMVEGIERIQSVQHLGLQ